MTPSPAHTAARWRLVGAIALIVTLGLGCGDEGDGTGGPNIFDTYMSITLDDGRTLRMGTLGGEGGLTTLGSRSSLPCQPNAETPQCFTISTAIINDTNTQSLGIDLRDTAPNDPPSVEDQRVIVQTGERAYLSDANTDQGVSIEVVIDDVFWSTRNVAQPEGASFEVTTARIEETYTEEDDFREGERWLVYAVFTGRLANADGETLDITEGEMNMAVELYTFPEFLP